MIRKMQGTVNDGFENVGEAFDLILASDERMGAALSVRIDGELVIDLWGGLADPRSSTAWSSDTLNVLFSATKGFLTILTLNLVQNGLLDLDFPVAYYWPEFGQAGKENITVRQVLSHRAGLSATRDDFRFDEVLDWETVVHSLESQTPLWEVGKYHAYHALTFGWLVGELIRRITKTTVGEFFQENIAKPLRADAWIGLPVSELPRVAYLTNSQSRDALMTLEDESDVSKSGWYDKALTLGEAFPLTLISADGGFNDPRAQIAEIPGAGGIATAHALAKIWSATVTPTDGIRVLNDGLISMASRVQSEGKPYFSGSPPYLSWGTGFQIDSPARKFLSDKSFGHDGSGGQVGFADPALKVGFGFVTNLLGVGGDTRATSLIAALRDALVGKN